MGSPLGPTIANIFLCHWESIWLQDCPIHFKPILYRRYVDDTFLIFKKQSHSNLFLKYINHQHTNIKFTSEHQSDNQLAFLDLNVTNNCPKLSTSIFRKQTFSGLGTSFFSYCSIKFRLNAINTLIHRAYHLSSSYINFSLELDFLHKYFNDNGYPDFLFFKITRRFLNHLYNKPP